MHQSGEPTPGAVAEPRPRVWGLALTGQFLFVFAVVALSSPGRIDIVDGQTRYEVARSLIEHGDSVIRDKYVVFAVMPGREGKPYTNYRFPQTGLGVIAIWLADASGPLAEARRQFFFSLISPFACALLALTYSLLFRGLGHGPTASLAWSTAGIFCTPNWYYGTSTFDDILAASAIVPALAIGIVLSQRMPLLSAVLGGLLLGWAFNCKQPVAIFVLPALAASWRPGITWWRQLAPLGFLLGGLALGVLCYKLYDWHKYPPETTDVNRMAEAMYGKVWTSDPLPGLVNLAISPSAGVLWHCPTLLLSIIGWMRWRRERPGYCWLLLLASLVFAGFLCLLTFFKGEPCWGPRYLTPVLALWWMFVPAGAVAARPFVTTSLLTLGCVVQLLAMSVDPMRMFLEVGLPLNYYVANPWLGLDPGASHLWQRGKEIREILANGDAVLEYSPAPIPTYAPTLPSLLPAIGASTAGLAAPCLGLVQFTGPAAHWLQAPDWARERARQAVHHYQIFASFRPWWINQQYLPPDERPVDLPATLSLLGGLAALGLGSMVAAARPC